ncbi:hypothetical protein ACVIGB_000530 [Bradyrhizobium sp. USDA 4341]
MLYCGGLCASRHCCALLTPLNSNKPSTLSAWRWSTLRSITNSGLLALESFTASRLSISARALCIGRDASLRSTGTYREHIPYSDLASFSELPRKEWEEGLAELEEKKLAYLGHGGMKLTWRFFCLFDPVFRGADPVGDAAMIAGRLADSADIFAASDDLARSDLEERRFNPAMMFLVEATDGRIRRTINGEWTYLGSGSSSTWSPNDRYRLRNVHENATQIALDLIKDPG